jgi:hypothetical protein
VGERSNRALKKQQSEAALAHRRSRFTNIVDAQKGLCWFCGEVMGADCTKEHLLAKAFGGTDTWPESNLKAAHMACNSAAGHLPVTDKERLREIGHEEGVQTMLMVAKQLRRADARKVFSMANGKMVVEKREAYGPKYWAKLGLSGKPSWWDG